MACNPTVCQVLLLGRLLESCQGWETCEGCLSCLGSHTPSTFSTGDVPLCVALPGMQSCFPERGDRDSSHPSPWQLWGRHVICP